MSVLRYSFYKPARGGHAPGDIRTAFEEAVDAFSDWKDGEPEPTIDVRGTPMTIPAVCGLLWNCRDTLPSLLCFALKLVGIERCGSYAQAARHLKAAYQEAVAAQ